MLDRCETSAELTQATEQAGAVIREYLTNPRASSSRAESAVCEMFRVLREHGWAPESTLAYGKRVVTAHIGAVRGHSDEDRERWLDAQLAGWLVKCYYAPGRCWAPPTLPSK